MTVLSEGEGFRGIEMAWEDRTPFAAINDLILIKAVQR